MHVRTWPGRGLATFALFLASCGGGGGGDTGNGDSPSLELSQSELRYVVPAQGYAQSQQVRVRMSGISGTYYVSAVADTGFRVYIDVTSSTAATASISPTGMITHPGSGSITFLLCRDSACNHVVWSRAVPYSISVFDVSPRTFAFSGHEGASPPSQDLTLSPADAERRITARPQAVYPLVDPAPPWLSVTRINDTTFRVRANSDTLAPGGYQARIVVDSGVAGFIELPVSLTVGTGTVAPTAISLDVNAATTVSDLAGSFPVAFNGSQSPAWSASTDRAWLQLSGTSGTGSGRVAYAVDTARLASMPNWRTDTATVTLRSPGHADVTFPVGLNMRLPDVHGVWPGPLLPGATSVKVTGRGFTGLMPDSFSLQGVQGVGATVLSDREAMLEMPAAAPATGLRLAVPNRLQLPARSALVDVVPQPALAAASAATTGFKRSLIVDPLRTALFSPNRSNNTLTRFRLVNGSWEVTDVPIPTIGDVGLSPDKRRLFVTSGSNTLLVLDPDTLQELARHVLPAEIRSGINLALPPNSYDTSGLPITNDMRLWFGDTDQGTRLTYFDLLEETFRFHSGDGLSNPWSTVYHPVLSVPADGSVMTVGQTGISPRQPLMVYSPDAPALVTLPGEVDLYGGQFSTSGARIYNKFTGVYDAQAQFSRLPGRFAAVTNYRPVQSVMSPDGRRIYRLLAHTFSPYAVRQVDVHDVDQDLAKIGEIALVDQAQACDPSSADYYCGVVAIHPAGHTLFWTGNRRLVVVPIPLALRASAQEARLEAARR